MPNTQSPYRAFNFLVQLIDPEGRSSLLGGFSEVTGLCNEVNTAEYRRGNDAIADLRRIPGSHKSAAVTLKRGVVDAANFALLRESLQGKTGFGGKVAITLRDEAGQAARKWTLHNVRLAKFTGPTLAAKGTDVAMEELVLSTEGVDTGAG